VSTVYFIRLPLFLIFPTRLLRDVVHVVPCRWSGIIGSSQQAARANFKKKYRLLHYTANTPLIPCFAQIYPQMRRNLKFCERRAIVFATISRVSFRHLLRVINEK
ncbi:hypothetical protein, partial [Rahnella sp. AA]|uniref:hypothetical protein n=1 Tax=Rahnella sp. AA TaxID=2057180 RepID=UPI001E452926